MRPFAVFALLLLMVVTPAIAEPYDGPPNGAAYWTVPGFKEYPLKGPAQAQGALFWSHGVKGRETQYQFAPPDLIRRFAPRRLGHHQNSAQPAK